jgi:hypothetical protein
VRLAGAERYSGMCWHGAWLVLVVVVAAVVVAVVVWQF